MSEKVERWIECDCPVTGVDFDIFEDDENFHGPEAIVPCCECGGEHRLGEIGQLLEKRGDEEVAALSEGHWRAIAGMFDAPPGAVGKVHIVPEADAGTTPSTPAFNILRRGRP